MSTSDFQTHALGLNILTLSHRYMCVIIHTHTENIYSGYKSFTH